MQRKSNRSRKIKNVRKQGTLVQKDYPLSEEIQLQHLKVVLDHQRWRKIWSSIKESFKLKIMNS